MNKNISSLDEKSVSSILEHTAFDGKNYKSKFYNIKTNSTEGSCLNSHRAIEFKNRTTKNMGKFGGIV